MNVPDLSELISYPSVIIITGKRGSGKTACGYYILENAMKKYNLEGVVMGIPEEKKDMLPNEIVWEDININLKDERVYFIDEAAVWFYARRWRSDLNELFDTILTVARQKKLLLILATHYTRKLDINIITDTDMLIFKKPGLLYKHFERRELRKIYEKVEKAFSEVNNDYRKYCYVLSEDYEGLARNDLPTFWREELSYSFYGIDTEKLFNKRLKKDEQITFEEATETEEDLVTKIERIRKMFEKSV